MGAPLCERSIDFGERVANLRAEKCLSASETARRAGIARQTLHRIEKGTTGSPSRDIIMRVAAALEIDAFRFFKLDNLSDREATFQLLGQHASEISDSDWLLVEEVKNRLTQSLQAAGKV